MKDKANSEKYDHDLENHEVKSAQNQKGFEYQYHKNHWEKKLDGDIKVDHVFISYTLNYSHVVVRLVAGRLLAYKFERWRPLIAKNYEDGVKQRFRRQVTYGEVTRQGHVILKIENGKLVNPGPSPQNA